MNAKKMSSICVFLSVVVLIAVAVVEVVIRIHDDDKDHDDDDTRHNNIYNFFLHNDNGSAQM